MTLVSLYTNHHRFLGRANICNKETPFLDLYIKVVDNDIHTNVCDNFGFAIVNCPWLSGAVPRLPFHG